MKKRYFSLMEAVAGFHFRLPVAIGNDTYSFPSIFAKKRSGHMISIVRAPAPYPPIAVTEPNASIAAILSRDFASAQSEMTTCTLYAYQRWIVEECHPKLANILCRIEKVEHDHYNVLGQLLHLLGWDPKCQCHQGKQTVVWTGGMPNYQKDVRDILEGNATMEEYAARIYREQSQEIQDPKVSAMLYRLSLDEELHVKIFREYLSALKL